MDENINELNKRIIKKIMIINFDDINGYSLKNIYPNFNNLNYFFSFKCLKNNDITKEIELNKMKNKRKEKKCKKYFSSSCSYNIYEKKKEKLENMINNSNYDSYNEQKSVSNCELLNDSNNLNIYYNSTSSKNLCNTNNLKNSNIIISSFNSNYSSNSKASSNSKKVYKKYYNKNFNSYKKKLTSKDLVDHFSKKFINKNSSEKNLEKNENNTTIIKISNACVNLKKTINNKKEHPYYSSNLSENEYNTTKSSLYLSEKSKYATSIKGDSDNFSSGNSYFNNTRKFYKKLKKLDKSPRMKNFKDENSTFLNSLTNYNKNFELLKIQKDIINLNEYSEYEMKIIMMYSIPYIKKKKLNKFNGELKNESIIITTELLNIDFFIKVIKFFSIAYFDIGFHILISFYENLNKYEITKEKLEIKLNYKNHNFYENIEINSINSNYKNIINSKNKKKFQENIFELQSLNNNKNDTSINIIRTNKRFNIENFNDHNFNPFKNANIYKNFFYFKEYLLIFFEMILLGYPICVLSKNVQS
ncbi:hypothetical protein PGAL8A_00145200 [Plasmodium gallinaceum]|uniref:Uncharacterized protein n=1 Tax=Plasmodium gallinaceum TaxID=5849 RepID=A0A1J1GRT5_PLAGA|nr:hypothetical protein PGAL8A_00145200 [Plasmodium gallinaceum]CRG93746.1 hypothetical protein PGAL8A_00145200 [Plasmodium gallinaceum]